MSNRNCCYIFSVNKRLTIKIYLVKKKEICDDYTHLYHIFRILKRFLSSVLLQFKEMNIVAQYKLYIFYRNNNKILY